jgi:hypothetical protein
MWRTIGNLERQDGYCFLVLQTAAYCVDGCGCLWCATFLGWVLQFLFLKLQAIKINYLCPEKWCTRFNFEHTYLFIAFSWFYLIFYTDWNFYHVASMFSSSKKSKIISVDLTCFVYTYLNVFTVPQHFFHFVNKCCTCSESLQNGVTAASSPRCHCNFGCGALFFHSFHASSRCSPLWFGHRSVAGYRLGLWWCFVHWIGFTWQGWCPCSTYRSSDMLLVHAFLSLFLTCIPIIFLHYRKGLLCPALPERLPLFSYFYVPE